MPPQREAPLNLAGTDSCHVTVQGLAGPLGPPGPVGPRGPPGGETGIGYIPLASRTYNEFTTGIKTFNVPSSDTNAYIAGMYIRIRDAVFSSWFMNGKIISYIGTTLTVDVDDITFGETGPTGVYNTSDIPDTTGHIATSLSGGHTCVVGPTGASYISTTRNEFTDANLSFIIEDGVTGVTGATGDFIQGVEVRATDATYSSWYMDATVIGYTASNLTLDIDSVQIGAGEIINELTSSSTFKFDTGVKAFIINHINKISAFSKDTTVRITTPKIEIGTYMNGVVTSFVENILIVRVDTVTTAIGFSLYTSNVCDWCIQALVNNDKYSGNNWKISKRDTIGINSDTRNSFEVGERAFSIKSGVTGPFTISRGVRIADANYRTWYMDGTVSGYTGTSEDLLVNVTDIVKGSPSNIVYQLNSKSRHVLTAGTKVFTVPITNTLSPITTNSAVIISPLNMTISSTMSGTVVSYSGTTMTVYIGTVNQGTEPLYPGLINNWNIEALLSNNNYSGSNWFVTLRNPIGARSSTRNTFIINTNEPTKTFTIQYGATGTYTIGLPIRVLDRSYPSWYMDGTITGSSGPNLSINVTSIIEGSSLTNIITKLTSRTPFKFEVGPKTFVVQDVKSLQAFTANNAVKLTANNMWIGMSMIGTITSYVGTNLVINITNVNTATGFVQYNETVNFWNIEVTGGTDTISGSDWVISVISGTLPTPTNVTATRAVDNTPGQLTVEWNIDTQGFSSITGYRITAIPVTP